MYIAKINKSNYTIEPCTKDDVNQISQHIVDFEEKYGVGNKEFKITTCLIF